MILNFIRVPIGNGVSLNQHINTILQYINNEWVETTGNYKVIQILGARDNFILCKLEKY